MKTLVDLENKVAELADDMPRQQRNVADFLLQHWEEFPFLSMQEIAERSQASEATVVRFAQKLGYAGFRQLKMNLMDLVRDPNPGLGVREGSDVLNSVANQVLANIENTTKYIQADRFEAFCRCLVQAEHVFTFGRGISFHLSEMTTYYLRQIGVRATTLSPNTSSALEQSIILKPNDCLLVFSFPPYSKSTLELLGDAGKRGVHRLAISDRANAPAIALSEHHLLTRIDNQLIMDSVAPSMMVMNAIITKMALLQSGRSLESMSQINDILSRDSDLKDIP